MNVDASNLILIVLLVGVGGWVTDYWQNPAGQRVLLNEPEVRPSHTVVLRAFSSTPTEYRYTYLGEELDLPDVEDPDRLRFFPLFVDKDLSDEDEMISVAVEPRPDGERLYVDRDDDEDLSDTEPVFFSHREDSMVVRIRGAAGTGRVTERVLGRVPGYVMGKRPYRERFEDRYHTEQGGMIADLAADWLHVFPRFTGGPDSFYYVYPKAFRRGRLAVRDTVYTIGLHDVDGDGLYDSDHDRIYVDADGNGRFELGEYFRVGQNLHVRGMHIMASRVDPLGSYVYFERGSTWF